MDTIKVKYLDKTITPLVHKGEWIDLRVSAVVGKGVTTGRSGDGDYFSIPKGATVIVGHGVAMQLPFGKEALTRPRSGLFKNYGLQFATSGVIDSKYCGPTDEWMTVMYATRDCILLKNERVCQFRTYEKMPITNFVIDTLENNENRGGHGSTGRF